MTSSKALYDLETLFIEKLTEKHKLNIRDVKRAFARFDTDSNGLLDITELSAGVQLFLNGVKTSTVQEMVSKYDVNGDGKVSYEEFLGMLTNRTAIDPYGVDEDDEVPISRGSRHGSGGGSRGSADRGRGGARVPPAPVRQAPRVLGEERWAAPREAVVDDYEEDEEEAYVSEEEEDEAFGYFEEEAPAAPPRGWDRSRNRDRPDTASDLGGPSDVENRCKRFLQALKQELTTLSARERPSRAYTISRPAQITIFAKSYLLRLFPSSVSLRDFSRVMRGFVFPGHAPLRDEAARYLWDLCTAEEVLSCEQLVDGLLDVLFGAQQSTGTVRTGDDRTPPAVPAAGQRPEPTEYLQQQRIARGPMPMAQADGQQMRFLSRKSRTALSLPSTYDPALTQRSAALPAYTLQRRFVHGISTTHYSGSIIDVIPGSGTGSATRPGSGTLGPGSGMKLIYTSAALGVVHDLQTNEQLHFDAHTDDVTCLARNRDGSRAITGCVGKSPIVYVWSTTSCEVLEEYKGLFQRGIAAVSFLPSPYTVAIGCDDQHLLAILAPSGCAASASACHGLPTAIRACVGIPDWVSGEYIARELGGRAAVCVTLGERHLRMWGFAPAAGNQQALLLYKALTLGKIKGSPPKIYTCAVFVPTSSTSSLSYDLVVGGSNGMLYMYRQADCIAATACMRGGISVLVTGSSPSGGYVYAGGGQDAIAVLDARTLKVLAKVHVAGGVPNVMPGKRAGPPSHAAGKLTPRSSSNPITPEEVVLPASSNGVLGLAYVAGRGRGGAGSAYLLVALGSGVVRRLDLGLGLESNRPSSAGASGAGAGVSARDLFHYHVGPVYGLAVARDGSLAATVGDDRRLMVWDLSAHCMLTSSALPEACRCIAVDRDTSFFAIGGASGSVYLYGLRDLPNGSLSTAQTSYRKDASNEITDITLTSSALAAGSRDSFIYVYQVTPSSLRLTHKLRGHSSSITHLDFSSDSLLLRSTCAAYELLAWDLTTHKQAAGVNIADVRWASHHCVLGSLIMGIWPLYSDGTDINALDVCLEKGLVLTGNDQGGEIRLLNYPCVIRNAPARITTGHSSHVMNVRFTRDGNTAVSVGGNDGALMLFDVVPVGK